VGVFRLLKPTIASIDIETIGGLFVALFEIVECAALHKICVEVAVSVNIDERRSASNDFGEQVSAGEPRLVSKRDSSGGGFFAEPSRAVPVNCYSWSF
jgi:hypothetical protein